MNEYIYMYVCVSVYIYICIYIFIHINMGAKSLQLCLTLCNPMDCSPQAPLSMGFSRQQY